VAQLAHRSMPAAVSLASPRVLEVEAGAASYAENHRPDRAGPSGDLGRLTERLAADAAV